MAHGSQEFTLGTIGSISFYFCLSGIRVDAEASGT